MNGLTLAEMALVVIQRKPGALPPLMGVKTGSDGRVYPTLFRFHDESAESGDSPLLDDIAHCVLRDAMAMATKARRDDDGWWVDDPNGSWFDTFFADVDHGDCPTRSLFAAFCAVYPANDVGA